jgi:hypothetical protein
LLFRGCVRGVVTNGWLGLLFVASTSSRLSATLPFLCIKLIKLLFLETLKRPLFIFSHHNPQVNMPIELKTNDFVQGGQRLDTPGSDSLIFLIPIGQLLTTCVTWQCRIHALAMAMASEPEVTRLLDWSAGTLETRYFDALMDLCIQYIKYNDENHILSRDDLTDIIDRWNRRYKDTYNREEEQEDKEEIKHESQDSASVSDCTTGSVTEDSNAEGE